MKKCSLVYEHLLLCCPSYLVLCYHTTISNKNAGCYSICSNICHYNVTAVAGVAWCFITVSDFMFVRILNSYLVCRQHPGVLSTFILPLSLALPRWPSPFQSPVHILAMSLERVIERVASSPLVRTHS